MQAGHGSRDQLETLTAYQAEIVLTASERRRSGRWGNGLPGTALTQIAEEKGRCWTLGYNVLGPEAIP
jgi:hypothetical protein